MIFKLFRNPDFQRITFQTKLSHLVRQYDVFALLQDLFHCIIEVGIANTGAVQAREQV